MVGEGGSGDRVLFCGDVVHEGFDGGGGGQGGGLRGGGGGWGGGRGGVWRDC